jgi:hypothetical protein
VVMRRAALAFMMFSGACTLGAVPASARDFAWCIRGDNYSNGLGDCSFATYQQCQATASGRAAYCTANPYFSENAEVSASKSNRRRR